MAEGVPPNLNSLQSRLRNHCRDHGLDEVRAQRHLAAMVVAQMLASTGAVVKGGRNLEIRYGLRATRASSDLDVVRAQSVDDFVDGLEDALEAGWCGFAGTVKDRGVIAAPVPEHYLPHRLEVKLTYNGKGGVGTVVLELAAEEAGGLGQVDVVGSDDAQALFAGVGLPAPEMVAVMSLPTQIAQKLHACTAPDDAQTGWINDRAHDLVDLQVLAADLDDEQLSEVRTVAQRLFAARKRHDWPPRVTLREGWEHRYRTELASVAHADLLPEAAAAVDWLNDFIVRVQAS